MKKWQVVLVDVVIWNNKKNLQGKEDESEFEQCLLHLFHDSSVQIHKESQRQLCLELRVVLLNQQRAFLPLTIDPCNTDSVWPWALQTPLQQWGGKRLFQPLQECIKNSNWTSSQILVLSLFLAKRKSCVSHKLVFKVLIFSIFRYYSSTPAALISELDLESDICQWKGIQRRRNTGSKPTAAVESTGIRLCKMQLLWLRVMWRLLHCLVCGTTSVQLMHSSGGPARLHLSGWNWSLRNARSCFKLWACSLQPWEDKRDFLLTKENSSQAELPLPWESHAHSLLKETLFVMKNLQVSLPKLQIKCPECGGNWTVWVGSGFALPFLDLAFYLGFLIFHFAGENRCFCFWSGEKKSH